MYERNILARDMKSNVVELIIDVPGGSKYSTRVTLHRDYVKNIDNITEIDSFHNSNSELLAGWDVINNAWKIFDISHVRYAQAMDGYS